MVWEGTLHATRGEGLTPSQLQTDHVIYIDDLPARDTGTAVAQNLWQ